MTEHFGRMDVADDVVDTLFVHNDFGDSRFDKVGLQLFQCRVDVDRDDFGTRNYTVAYLDVGKIEGILEDFYLGLDVLFVFAFDA